MRKPPSQPRNGISLIFGLTDESVEFRNRWRMLAALAAWLLLSGLTMVLTVFQAQESMHRAVIIVLSFLKYLPLLFVVYGAAKARAAHYLDDIFELKNEPMAADFIEEVAFGYGHEHITIDEGRISENDEHSPIILIGGPGEIQVNLGSVALLEKLDGDPEAIFPRSEPWKLGRFERIREIGTHDEVGRREYAIINLRDQFVSGLSVKSRTKDGIPIEAQDIKIIFSILRTSRAGMGILEGDPYQFDERAVHALVYNQTIIKPPPSTPSGVTFPWDTTVIPLVTSELEKLITSRTLSEILASISQRELDSLNHNEETIAQMRVEMTGEQTRINQNTASRPPNFETRSKITAQFFDTPFREKAAKLGVAVEWIDVGTWQLPSGIILDKLKEAWDLMRANTKRKHAIERSAKKRALDELLELINGVILANFEKSAGTRSFTNKELEEFEKLIANNPELASDRYVARRYIQQTASRKDANTVALEILKAFRKELLAARELIQKESGSPIDRQVEIARIDKALSDITAHTAHYIKGRK